MKKYLFLIFFFYSIITVHAVLVESTLNDLPGKTCYTSNNEYIGCFTTTGNGYMGFYLYSQTGAEIDSDYSMYAAGNQLALPYVIESPRYDYLIMQLSGVYSSISIVIVDKTTHTIAYAMTYSGGSWNYSGYNYISNGHSKFYFYGTNGGYISFDILPAYYTIGTDIPSGALYKPQKMQLFSSYNLYKDTDTLELRLQENSGIYPFSIAVGNYVLLSGNTTFGLGYYADTVRTSLVLSGAIKNYNLDITTLYNTGGLIQDVLIDNYTIINNAEIYDLKNNADTPLGYIFENNFYYIKNTDYTLNKAGSNGIYFNGEPKKIPNQSGSLLDVSQCQIDINNDGKVSILNGEFFIGFYNCILYGVQQINNGFSNIFDLTNTIKDIGNTQEEKSFVGFLFGIETTNASAFTDAFNDRDPNGMLYKIIHFILYGIYAVMVIASILFLISLKKK